MTTDELSELPLDELMKAVETLGVSSVDELFALIMNKNVSSASKSEENSFTSPLATTVITRDELRTYGATTIEDAFRLIPGMIVQQKFNGVYDIHMRGLNYLPDNNSLLYTENNNTLLMVDGRIVNNYITGAMQMERLPISIEDVERIEVVRGACSALYGMNAVNGVINIITEKPSSSSKLVSGSFQMGNQNTYTADLAFRKSINDKWSYGVTFNMQHRGRPNDKVWIAPSEGIYVANNQTSYRELLGVDPGMTTEERKELIAKNAKQVELMGSYSVDEMSRMIKVVSAYDYAGDYEYKPYFYRMNEENTSVYDIFSDSDVARKNFGINGYLRFAPSKDVTIDLTGGYQNSFINTTPMMQYSYVMIGQTSKTGYLSLDARIKDFHFMGSFSGGPQNLAKGIAGFKTSGDNLNIQADYDINLGESFLVRPSIAYQHLYYKDYESTSNGVKQTGFFNDDASLSTIAPSLRLDYHSNGWRVIGGIRGDKTSAPDKWNVSWQGVVAQELNEKNFIRAVYGKSFRAPNMINTATSYVWDRRGLDGPDRLKYIGSTDADLMSIDNIELGYRWQPTPAILLDAEVYYSQSKDYGALMSTSSVYSLTPETFATNLGILMTEYAAEVEKYADDEWINPDTDLLVSNRVAEMMNGQVTSYSNIGYQNLPYKVKQLGLSLNLDWIISSKLIFKVNANVQKTMVDSYYDYNQNIEITKQVDDARYNTVSALEKLYGGVLDNGQGYLNAAFGKAYMDDFKAKYDYDNWDKTPDSEGNYTWDKHSFLEVLQNAYLNGETDENGNAHIEFTKTDGTKVVYDGMPLSLMYELLYKVHQVKDSKGNVTYEVGESEAAVQETQNGLRHKSTPAVYGMVGLVYKPIKELTISAYGNYMHHRTYSTTYSHLFQDLAKDRLDNYTSDEIDWGDDADEDWVKEWVEWNDGLLVDAKKYMALAKKTSTVRSKFSLNLRVGYNPTSNIELFINAQNLLNNDEREFVYTDKIGGMYSVGLNFGF